jgi:hypothetical protein
MFGHQYHFSEITQDKKSDSLCRANRFSFLVPGVGIEPTQLQEPRDFKSLASTSSATQAPLFSLKRLAVYIIFNPVCQGFDRPDGGRTEENILFVS